MGAAFTSWRGALTITRSYPTGRPSRSRPRIPSSRMCCWAETESMIRRLAEKTWAASSKESRTARTVVLKLKTAEFQVLTRSQTPPAPPASCDELTQIALSLRDKVSLDPRQRFRLVGVGLGNF